MSLSRDEEEWETEGGAVPPEKKISPREQVLRGAIEAITQQRNNEYGPPTQDFTRTAVLWSELFRNKLGNQNFEAHEVAMAMILLKMSRATWSPDKEDHWLDVAGYAACGWECVGG